MRTKIFAAFILVISIALLSNIIFQWLIMKDFGDYVRGVREDHLYWVLASIEGSYEGDKWNMDLLNESVHWAMMLGFDVIVRDINGQEVTDSHKVMESLPESMKHRMASIIHISPVQETHDKEGYEGFPLFIGGKEIGTMYVRAIDLENSVRVKERVFRNRGRNFLLISFLIAGLSAVVMAIFLSLNLTRPLRRLKEAAERIAEGKIERRFDLFRRKRGMVKIFERDEVEKLSESFNYMARTLEKEEILRKRLTSNIAHELRTPLTIMKASIEAMIDGIVSDSKEGLGNIKSEIERLQHLIEGIEDFAKAEASFIKRGETASVNLRELLNNIAFSMKSLFEKKGLYVKITEKEDMNVVTEVEKIEGILRNILSNSLKYTEQGGVVVDYGRHGDGFYIEVRDSGIGIREEDMDKVFRRFYSSGGEDGFGLGLAIVKELVEVMNGRIFLKSTHGEGTTLRIELPNPIS